MSSLQFKPKSKHVANAFYIYSRLFSYMRSYWGALLLGGMASMVYSGVDAWFIHFLKPLLDHGLVEQNHYFLARAPYLVLGVFILRGISSFFSSYYIAAVSRYVILRLRQELFAHLQRLPAYYYDHSTTGRILSVLLYAVDQVANASADVLVTAIQALCLIVGLIIVMLTISWKLTLLYFLIIPLVTVIMRVASLRIRFLSFSIQDSIADLSHQAAENIDGYKMVRIFAGQACEIAKFNRAAWVNRQREMKIVTARSLSAAAVQFIVAAAFAMTLYIATLDSASSLLSPGDFVALCAAMLALLKPMKDLALVQNKLYRGLTGAQSVFELLDEKTEEDGGTRSLVRAVGKIEFLQVHFTYPGGKQVLHDVSFAIAPGEVIALVGRSGSGKSTLVNLLSRFYDNYSGDIRLDDIAIRDFQLKDLRQQLSMVSQQVTLFHDTIANNIAYGCSHASQADIIAAAKAAYCTEFISQLPDQFNTLLGEKGVLLSGGQRQRIAIARAILKDAPILILDEATSALDTESERYIQAALEALMENRTTLVVAHRLSTIEHADKIIVLNEGRIIEMGQHEELFAHNGYYTQLYRMQFRDVSKQNRVYAAS